MSSSSSRHKVEVFRRTLGVPPGQLVPVLKLLQYHRLFRHDEQVQPGLCPSVSDVLMVGRPRAVAGGRGRSSPLAPGELFQMLQGGHVPDEQTQIDAALKQGQSSGASGCPGLFLAVRCRPFQRNESCGIGELVLVDSLIALAAFVFGTLLLVHQ